MVPLTGIILIIVVSIFRRDPERRRQDFIAAAMFVAYAIAGGLMQEAVYNLRPQTCDAKLLAIDRALHFDTLAFARLLAPYHLPIAFLMVAYVFLPAVIGLAWVTERNETLRRVCVLGGCLVFAFYWLWPAVGPGNYNWTAGHALACPRNCVPSMHFGWALMLACNARGRALKVSLWCYALVIAVATMALGEHYLIDLIAAVPFVAGVQYIELCHDRKSFGALSGLSRPAWGARYGEPTEDNQIVWTCVSGQPRLEENADDNPGL